MEGNVKETWQSSLSNVVVAIASKKGGNVYSYS